MRVKSSYVWKKVLFVLLFASLIFSLFFSVIHFFAAPDTQPIGAPYAKTKGDYLLMTAQCVLGLAVMFLPALLNRTRRFEFPNHMYILYFVFLYCAIYLGEFHDFYNLIPHWDTLLHTFSGAMLGALGFFLVSLLNHSPRARVELSPRFIAFFAFCFALAAGAVWEIYEFAMDGLLGLNMQKFVTNTGKLLTGRAALTDTMKDLIVDALGAAGVVLVGYLSSVRHKKGDAHPV